MDVITDAAVAADVGGRRRRPAGGRPGARPRRRARRARRGAGRLRSAGAPSPAGWRATLPARGTGRVVVRVARPAAAGREACLARLPRRARLRRAGGARPRRRCAGDRTALVLAQGPSLSLMESARRQPDRHPAAAAVDGRGARRAAPGGRRRRPGRRPRGHAPLAALDAVARRARPACADFGAERAWLARQRSRPGGAAIVCHGDLQPASMRLDGDDTSTAMLVNWSAARVADAEYDVALTLLMFWSAPYLAEGMGQRKMLKTVRDMITDGYRRRLRGRRRLGAARRGRLRYWGAPSTPCVMVGGAGGGRAAGRTRRRLGPGRRWSSTWRRTARTSVAASPASPGS